MFSDKKAQNLKIFFYKKAQNLKIRCTLILFTILWPTALCTFGFIYYFAIKRKIYGSKKHMKVDNHSSYVQQLAQSKNF